LTYAAPSELLLRYSDAQKGSRNLSALPSKYVCLLTVKEIDRRTDTASANPRGSPGALLSYRKLKL